jgi:two-component system alkaline phosphatase synthesis response regulator PhoP
LGLEDDLRLDGHSVEVVRDGDTGARRARAPEWDLVLLDAMLPKKDGFDVCRELRSAGVKVPVILLTARTQEADKILGLEIGADDYITKPFSPRELRARIKAVTRRFVSTAPDRTWTFGDIEVDLGRAEVRRAGVVVDVTAIEIKLLAAFIARRGKILRRDQLLDAVWGSGVHVTDRAVDQHVMNLRRKIEADPARPALLRSVRGLGYRFDG